MRAPSFSFNATRWRNPFFSLLANMAKLKKEFIILQRPKAFGGEVRLSYWSCDVPLVPFKSSNISVPLKPAPIAPEWIEAGNPVARAAEISRSHDGTAFTVIWECTAGAFTWTYDFDETVHILEGSMVLTDIGNAPRRLGPGDIVFFPKGSKVHWLIEDRVRKLAFFRKVLPNPLSGPYKLLRRVKLAVTSGRRVRQTPMPFGAIET